MKITDKMRLDFMSRKGVTWNFTPQMGKGVYRWSEYDQSPPDVYCRSVRSMIDAAMRQEEAR